MDRELIIPPGLPSDRGNRAHIGMLCLSVILLMGKTFILCYVVFTLTIKRSIENVHL